MSDNLPHPNFETLSAFADGESVGEEDARHVGGCSTCGDVVAMVRAIPESLAVRDSSDPVRPQRALQAALAAYDAGVLPPELEKFPLRAPSGRPLHLSRSAAVFRFRPVRWVGIVVVGAAAALTLAFVVNNRNRDRDQLIDNVALGGVTSRPTGTDGSPDTLVESAKAPPVAGAGADTTVAPVPVARPAPIAAAAGPSSTAPRSSSDTVASPSSTAQQASSDAVRAGPVVPAIAKSGPSRKSLSSASSPPPGGFPPESVVPATSGGGRQPAAAAQTSVEAAASPSASGLTADAQASKPILAAKRPVQTAKKSKLRKPTVNFGASSNKVTTPTITDTAPAYVSTAPAATRAAPVGSAAADEASAPTRAESAATAVGAAAPNGSSASPFSGPTADLGDTSTLTDLLDNMAARLAPTPTPTAVSSTSAAGSGPTTSPAPAVPCQSAIEQEFGGPALATALGRVQGRPYVVAAAPEKILAFDALTCSVATSRSR